MRLIFLLFLVIYCALPVAFGQNLIALQHNGGATFFTTIPAAVTAAASGDTIYLPGGSFPGFSIDKKLAIIGVGHHPDSTAATGMTLISGDITMVSSECDGSMFTGLRLSAVDNHGDNDSVQILRCYSGSFWPTNYNYNGMNGSENWTISECMFGDFPTSVSGAFISNNLMSGNFPSGAVNCQIQNNIIFGNFVFFGNSCMINNNIYENFPNVYPMQNCLFNNNLFCAGNLPNGIFGTANIGTGNLNAPVFDSLFTNFSYNAFDQGANHYTFNYHLINPAYNTGGTDGTPIGIYGGVYPWKDGSLPFNPHILSKTIGSTTDPNGNLLINIQVKAQDH